MRRPTARNESRRPRHSRARLQNDHLVQASPSSPTTGMWLSQNASMRRHPPCFPESDDSAARGQDRPETHSMPGTAFAHRSNAYRPEQIMEARQNGWMDQPLANSDHRPGLYIGSSDPLMWGTSVANIGLRRGRYRPAFCSLRVARRRSSRSRFNSSTPADVAGVRIRIDPWLSPASRCRFTYEHHHLAAPLPSPGWTSPRPQICMKVRR